jgi:protein-S-isoprenylcysteine O-methyltransferase Ste14
VNPLAPNRTSNIVATGIYKLSRNPMYLGMVFCLSGLCVYLSTVTGGFLVLFYIVFLTRFQIAPEERMLVEKFGVEFEVYCSRVRRWL